MSGWDPERDIEDLERRLACDHDQGRALTAVYSCLRVYVRCWLCELRDPVGWRWQMTTVGEAIKAHYLKELP